MRAILAAALLVAMAWAFLWPAARCGYIWDDDRYVQDNVTLRTPGGIRGIWLEIDSTPQYYPMVHTGYWLEYRLWQLDPTGYHVVNILLHAIGAVLLWRVLAFLRLPGAWVAAAVFAVHPVHVESVAWITERKNVLSGVFYLGAALAYLRFALRDPNAHRPRAWWLYTASLALYVCALGSKTVTCSLPAAMLLVTWWKRGRIGRSDVWPLLPLFAVGIASGLFTAWLEVHQIGAAGPEWDLSLVDRFLVAGRALWFYAGKIVWPAPLVFIYPRWIIDASVWWQYLYPLAAAGAVVALWLFRKRLGRGPLAAVLFFAGTLTPALGFFNVFPHRYAFVADHFQYLAGIGLIALLVGLGFGGASRLGQRGRWVAPGASAAVLAVLGALSLRQVHIYVDQETLWRDTLQKNPGAWIAHSHLGVSAQRDGRLDEAIEHHREALRLAPHAHESYTNLCAALRAQGRLDEAVGYCRQALDLEPGNAEALVNLALALREQGQVDAAVGYLRHALQVRPGLVGGHANLGLCLLSQGRVDGAVGHLRSAGRLRPDHADMHYNLALTLLEQDQTDEALARFRQALEIDPEHVQARFGLGAELVALGRFDQGIPYLREVVRVVPDDAGTRYLLGRALVMTGQIGLGLARMQEAVRLDPDEPTVLNDVAWILATFEAHRRPEEAVRLAERAAELTNHEIAEMLDTLAAAYAAAGRFDQAVATGEAALDKATADGNIELWQALARRLAMYRQDKPYVEEP
jgi:tetratricopeptide (TPR) repeat protein